MIIVGYDYRASRYCPTHLIEQLVADGDASPAAIDMNEEEVLDQIAGANGIDRRDERSFDSGDFPKVVLSVNTEGEDACETCGEVL
jgi:hypothetical protein